MATQARGQSGQALMEMALILPIFVVFLLGLVDFTRAIYDRQVTMNMAGEGSSLALRGTTLTDTAAALMLPTGSDLNMGSNGCVIVTSVNSPDGRTFKVTGQATSTPCNAGSSRIGTCTPVGGNCTGSATLPSYVQIVLMSNTNTTVYVTEVYYKFSYVTAISYWLHNPNILPSQLYSVAFY